MTTKTVSNLDEKVRESLRNRIVSGDLGSGAHLSELKLSKEFNVSRTPIREALCALAADGLVEMVPHRGAFVRTVSETEFSDQQFIYSQLIAMAARIAVERAGIESNMQLETEINNIDFSSTVSLVKCAESLNNSILEIASSDALQTAVNAVSRRMLSAPLWLNDQTQLENIKKEYSYLAGAFKRGKADVAEKSMRQLMTFFSEQSQTHQEMSSVSTSQTVNASTSQTVHA